jgi:hypothetical protein
MQLDSGQARADVRGPAARSTGFLATAAWAAFLTAGCGLLYSASFVIVARASAGLGGGLSAAFLMLGGLLGAGALVGLYERLRAEAGAALLWALVVGLAGAFAAVLHGGYDLANAIHPPGAASGFPSQVDPRGLGTFGLAGVSLLGFSALMARAPDLGVLRALGFVSGALLVLVYLARLVLLDPANPLVLAPAAIEGFVVNPAWYVCLGVALRRAAT